MSKPRPDREPDPNKLPPESEPIDRAATPREDGRPDGESAAIADRSIRAGLADPQASVRAEFAAHVAKLDALPAEHEDAAYRGPFVVSHTFRFTDAQGVGHSIDATRPSVGGGRERRVIQRGDIPDDVAQEMWALGALQLPPPPAPPAPRTRLR